MRLASALIVVVFLNVGITHAAQLPAAATAVSPVQAATTAGPGQNDIQELRQDLQKMKGLVQQMEKNLAFVDTTQSPLKHQFQLEIDMWKTVIEEMDRKLNSSKRP
ncbi:MAG TPA: hypothetical protein VKW06_08780 [Candidatus Angelobacter sp.]|nr:hypothetical protein [Candidatus Angelobacter sp.]